MNPFIKPQINLSSVHQVNSDMSHIKDATYACRKSFKCPKFYWRLTIGGAKEASEWWRKRVKIQKFVFTFLPKDLISKFEFLLFCLFYLTFLDGTFLSINQSEIDSSSFIHWILNAVWHTFGIQIRTMTFHCITHSINTVTNLISLCLNDTLYFWTERFW